MINKKFIKIIPAGLYFGFIWLLSSQELFIDISGIDKFLHLIEYAIMGFLLSFALNVSFDNLKRTGKIFLVIAPLSGAIDEFHQAFVPTRTPDGFDFLADIIGCAIGLAIFMIITGLLKKLRKKST